MPSCRDLPGVEARHPAGRRVHRTWAPQGVGGQDAEKRQGVMECRVRDVPVYYEEFGAGRPVLLLHGRPGDHRYVAAHMEPVFAQRPGWRRLYPDLPGMGGRTPGADWITRDDDLLEIALGFLDAVAPGEPVAVAGLSYGGYLALAVVRRRLTQVSGALLWAPVVQPEPAKRRTPPPHILVHDPAFTSALEADEIDVMQFVVVQSREYLADFRATLKPSFDAADTAFLARVAATGGFSFDVDALPEPFPAPALIVAGRQDGVAGYQDAWELLDLYPRATFAVLDRAGHGLALEQQTLFRALVGEWLDRVEEYVRQR
jgi:pimeloyl-ACP methyl ester carboxylesterase